MSRQSKGESVSLELLAGIRMLRHELWRAVCHIVLVRNVTRPSAAHIMRLSARGLAVGAAGVKVAALRAPSGAMRKAQKRPPARLIVTRGAWHLLC